MRYKKIRLIEKLKQLKLLSEINDGELPREYLENIKKEEVDEHMPEVMRLRKYQDKLMSEI